MREVVIKVTSQKDLIKHQSSATTFGELKKEVKQVKWSGMRVVERSTKTTLQMDEAVLPQGDFVLFLVPEKVKSGRKTEGGVEKLDDINTANYNELRSHMSWLNRNKGCSLNMQGGTEDLRRRLKDYYRRQGKKAPAKKPAAKPAAKKAAPKKAAKKPAAKKPAAKKPAPKPAPKKKAPKKEKKGLFGKKKAAPKPVDPIETIEDARQMINMAVDEIVQGVIQGKAGVPDVLEYTAAELEKEAKEIHRKLRTSRSQAKYID